MALEFDPADLEPFADIESAKAKAMVDDALAMARVHAPCIDDGDFAYPDAAKAIIRGAILRWNETGAGGLTQVTDTVGPFGRSESYQQPVRRALFWPSEMTQLQKLCKSSSGGRAYEVDLTPSGAGLPDESESAMWWP
jgi:hypothetical protein